MLMFLCFTHTARKLTFQTPHPWQGGGETALTDSTQREAVFCGQSQILAITVARITRTLQKSQTAPFHPFFLPSANWGSLDKQELLIVG